MLQPGEWRCYIASIVIIAQNLRLKEIPNSQPPDSVTISVNTVLNSNSFVSLPSSFLGCNVQLANVYLP